MMVIISFFLFVFPLKLQIIQAQQYLPPQPNPIPGFVKQEYPPFPGSPKEEEISSGGMKEPERPQFSRIPQENLPSEPVQPQERYSSFYGAMQKRFPLLRYPLERYDPLLDPLLRKYSPFLDSPRTRYAQIHPPFLEVRYPTYLRMPEERGYPEFPLPSLGNKYPLFPGEIQTYPLFSGYSSPSYLQYGSDVLSENGGRVDTVGNLHIERPREGLTAQRIGDYYLFLTTSLPSPKEEGEKKPSSAVTKIEEAVTKELQNSSAMLSTLSGAVVEKKISEDGKVKSTTKQSLNQSRFTTEQKLNNSFTEKYFSHTSPKSNTYDLLSRNKQRANPRHPSSFLVTMPSVKIMNEASNSSSEVQENFVLFTTKADDFSWIPPQIHSCWATGADAGSFLKDDWCKRNCARGGRCPENSNIHCRCISPGYI